MWVFIEQNDITKVNEYNVLNQVQAWAQYCK